MLDHLTTPVSAWWAIAFLLATPFTTLAGAWWGYRRADRRDQARHEQWVRRFNAERLAAPTVETPHDPVEFARVIDEMREDYLLRREANGWRSELDQ